MDGMWEKVLDRLRAGCDEAEGPDWTISADSTVVRARQHAAGARHAMPCPRSWSRGAPPNDKNPAAGREAVRPPSTPHVTGSATPSSAAVPSSSSSAPVATRYDKRDFMYQATIDVASIRIWLRDPVP